jgi:hypothetical protein
MARRERPVLLMLVSPILLAMAAAGRKYPFHGRVILCLVPSIYRLLSEGVDWFRVALGRKAFAAVALLLLAHPCLSTLDQSQGPRMCDFNAHGDLHKNRFVD